MRVGAVTKIYHVLILPALRSCRFVSSQPSRPAFSSPIHTSVTDQVFYPGTAQGRSLMFAWWGCGARNIPAADNSAGTAALVMALILRVFPRAQGSRIRRNPPPSVTQDGRFSQLRRNQRPQNNKNVTLPFVAPGRRRASHPDPLSGARCPRISISVRDDSVKAVHHARRE